MPSTHPLLAAVDRALHAVETVADRYDELPISAGQLCRTAFTAWQDRRKAVAATDPRWVARTPGSAVTWDTYRQQRALLDELLPEPAWIDRLRTIMNHRTATPVVRLRMTLQRAARGWSDADLASLDFVLCTRLADQLEALADVAHGWPGTEEFPTFESWTDALRAAAADLRRIDPSADTQAAYDVWHAALAEEDAHAVGLRTSSEPAPSDTDALFTAAMAREDADRAAVSRGLAWVAAHHQHLWD